MAYCTKSERPNLVPYAISQRLFDLWLYAVCSFRTRDERRFTDSVAEVVNRQIHTFEGRVSYAAGRLVLQFGFDSVEEGRHLKGLLKRAVGA